MCLVPVPVPVPVRRRRRVQTSVSVRHLDPDPLKVIGRGSFDETETTAHSAVHCLPLPLTPAAVAA